jgi:hypothetical protein
MINSQQRVSGATTSDAPAAITNGDSYILAWVSDTDQTIWWTSCQAASGQASYNWNKPSQLSNAGTSGGPALASLKGNAWMAWKGQSADTRIFISSFSGGSWSPAVPISGIGTSSAPALAATRSELFLAWKGESDGNIFWSKSSDGKTWSKAAAVPGGVTSNSPALAGWEDAVYFAWKSASDSSIWFANWSDAGGWGATAAKPSPTFETSAAPALGVGDSGNVHLVWKGASDNSIYAATLGANDTWSGWTKIPVVATSTRPSLASQGSAVTDILLAWKGASGNDVWVGPLDALENQQVLNYNFGIGPVNVVTQRTRNTGSDSDYLTLTVAVGSKTPVKSTISLGDHSYGDVFNANLSVDVDVADDEKVVMSYIMLNHGNSQPSTQIISNLESAGETLAKAAIDVYSTEAAAGVGALLNVVLPGVGLVIIPILDSALIAIGNWLVSAVANLINVINPDCDGPVASGVHAFTGAQLRNGPALAPPLVSFTTGTDKCVGINSPSGCGDNSLYDVSWAILGK